MSNTIMNQLVELKLSGMASALSTQTEQPGTYEELSFNERLALLVSREQLVREQRKQSRLLQKARLRLEATVHDIDYQPSRNLERARIAQLSQSEWIAKDQNLLITGPCGCGKTYMGCALGHNACQRGVQRAIQATKSPVAGADAESRKQQLSEATGGASENTVADP